MKRTSRSPAATGTTTSATAAWADSESAIRRGSRSESAPRRRASVISITRGLHPAEIRNGLISNEFALASGCILVAAHTLFPGSEDSIRRFTVGLLALAAIAAAGFIFARRRPSLIPEGDGRQPVDDLYAAGL